MAKFTPSLSRENMEKLKFEIDKLELRLQNLHATLDYERAQAEEARKARYAAEARVSQLEQELEQANHAVRGYKEQARDLTIRNAELSGYVQRVYEAEKANHGVVEIPQEPRTESRVPYPAVLRSSQGGVAGAGMATADTVERFRRPR